MTLLHVVNLCTLDLLAFLFLPNASKLSCRSLFVRMSFFIVSYRATKGL